MYSVQTKTATFIRFELMNGTSPAKLEKRFGRRKVRVVMKELNML